jgi:hypothetical protein
LGDLSRFVLCPVQRQASGFSFPVLVKLAPDLTDNELDDALGVILYKGMDGLIATNTTLVQKGLRSAQGKKSGGLSGSPLKVLSETQLEKIIRRVGGPTLFSAWGHHKSCRCKTPPRYGGSADKGIYRINLPRSGIGQGDCAVSSGGFLNCAGTASMCLAIIKMNCP